MCVCVFVFGVSIDEIETDEILCQPFSFPGGNYYLTSPDCERIKISAELRLIY